MDSDPGQEIFGQLQSLMAGVEMRLADALSSGADMIQTAKIFQAGKFYTKPERAGAGIRDNRFKINISVSKPIDLRSLTLSWSFAIAKSSTDVGGLNYGKFDPLGTDVNTAELRVSDNTLTDKADKVPRLCAIQSQLMRFSEIWAVIPMYMIRKLMVHINGALVGEIPPSDVSMEMPHWLTFISVLYNTFDRPKPISLDVPFTFPQKADGKSEKVYFWWNTLTQDCLKRYDMDYPTTSGLRYYYAMFPLGQYFEQHFGHPTRWLTWGNNMDISVEFHPSDVILEYCLFRNSGILDRQDATATGEEPVFHFGPVGFVNYMTINDQNAEIFNELNALVMALSPLVYRRPYYEQRINFYQKVQRGQPFTYPFQTTRRPRVVMLQALQFKPGITGTDASKYENYTTPWPFRFIPFDKVTCRLYLNYLSQQFEFEEIRFDNRYGDGTDGTYHMWNQFKEIVGSVHHRRNAMKPINYYEWYTSWPCHIFRLDTAPISAIVLDQKMGYGNDTLHFKLTVSTDSTVHNDLDDKNVYWCLTLISDDMTTIDQSGQFRYNNRPDMVSKSFVLFVLLFFSCRLNHSQVQDQLPNNVPIKLLHQEISSILLHVCHQCQPIQVLPYNNKIFRYVSKILNFKFILSLFKLMTLFKIKRTLIILYRILNILIINYNQPFCNFVHSQKFLVIFQFDGIIFERRNHSKRLFCRKIRRCHR